MSDTHPGSKAAVQPVADTATTPPVRPATGGRKTPHLLREPWLADRIVNVIAEQIAEDGNLHIHFDGTGDGALIQSVALLLAANEQLKNVRITIAEPDNARRARLIDAAFPSEDLWSLPHEAVRHLVMRDGGAALGPGIVSAIAFVDPDGANSPTTAQIVVVPSQDITNDERVTALAAAIAKAERGGDAGRRTIVAAGRHSDDAIAALQDAGFQLDWTGYLELAAEARQTAAAASGQPTDTPVTESLGNVSDSHELWRNGTVFQCGTPADWKTDNAAARDRALTTYALANKDQLTEFARLLVQRAERGGDGMTVLVAARCADLNVWPVLAALLGGTRHLISADVRTDDELSDPNQLNGDVHERVRTILGKSDWEKIASPWYREGHFSLRDHVVRALSWLSQGETQSVDHALRKTSVNTTTYSALAPDLRRFFSTWPNARGRHAFDPPSARSALNKMIAALRPTEDATQKRFVGIAADEVALLPARVRVQLFQLLPGTGFFKPLPYPDAESQSNKATPVTEDENATPGVKQYDAIVVMPDLIHDGMPIENALDALISELKPKGLLLVPRRSADRLVGWFKSRGLRPARWSNNERIHAGFAGAIALRRFGVESPWSYPSSAEIAEAEALEQHDYHWLFQKGDGDEGVVLGPPVLQLDNISLSFANKSVLFDPTRIFARGKADKESRVLKDLTLTVRRGEVVGVVGRNGSGKSTLMRLLVGAYLPDVGSRWIDGDTRLVTVGTGLNVELTGYANLMMMGRLIGMTKTEIEEQLDDIVEFTELGNALNRVVRHYSSGMRSRLAFAVATAKQADILILDEVFATGDKFFVEKSKQRIRRLIEGAKAVIIVSHQTGLLSQIATRVIWLEGGTIHMDGHPDDVLPAYLLSG